MGTIIFHLWNEASLINCKAITIVKRLQKILPESPEETAGSYCKCLGGHAGATTCVCALCVIVLFCNNLGESVRAPLRWTGGVSKSIYTPLVFTGKCRRPWRQHICHHCDTAPWRKPWALLAPWWKNLGDLRERLLFTRNTPSSSFHTALVI